MNNKFLLFLLASAPLLSACSTEDVDSDQIHTGGIYADMRVEASTDNVSTVAVTLLSGGKNSNTYVNLVGGDELVSTIDGSHAKTLSKHSDGSEISYVATYNVTGAGAENARYNVAFNRPADTSAPTSYVDIPAAVSNLSVDKTTFSRATEQLTLTWDTVNNTGNLALHVSGDCIDNFSTTTSDVGIYTINAGALTGSTSSCALTVSLTRSTTGNMDTAFTSGEGGKFSASQVRYASVFATP